MAESPTVIIKKSPEKDYRTFYGPLDKGANKPSFCYPQRIERMAEEVKQMEKALEHNHVPPDHRAMYEANFKKKKTRLEGIREWKETAEKEFNKDPDFYQKRFKDLKKEIRELMPSRKEVKEKRVNPHTVLKREKSGLEDKKREFMVLGKLLGEETNVSFLQRD